MISSEDYHINIAGPVDDYIEPDMNCPSIGTTGNNFWKFRCEERKRQGNPCVDTCGPIQRKRKQVKSGTTEPYKPKKIQKKTLRSKIVKLTKNGLAPKEISIKLDLEVKKVRDHLNKARRFGELTK